MNRRMEIAVLVVVLVFSVAGCRKSGPEPRDANEPAGQPLKEKATEALQATTDLLAQQKDRLLRASKTQLDKLQQQFGDWRQEAGFEDERAREKVSELSQSFESALGEARAALEKAGQGGADAWQDIKPTVETAVQKAQKSYDEFVSFVKTTAQEIQRPEETQTVEE